MEDLAKELFEEYRENNTSESNGFEYNNTSFRRWLENNHLDPNMIIDFLDLERNSEDKIIDLMFDSLQCYNNGISIYTQIEEFKNEPVAFSFICNDFKIKDIIKDLICVSKEEEKQVKEYLRYILKQF